MRPSRWLLLGLATGCATLGEGGVALDHLPSANAGPFRPLRSGEVGEGRPAPYALGALDAVREVSVADADGDPTTESVVAIGRREKEGAEVSFVRFEANDSRSFQAEGIVVLEPTEPWESRFADPTFIAVSPSDQRIYYVSERGIEVATSKDGTNFIKASEPALEGELSGPTVVRTRDDGFHLFYLAGAQIHEATSADGARFIDEGPVLTPHGELESEGILDPSATTLLSPSGREILWLYYIGRSDRTRVLAAARDEEDENGFSRVAGAVLDRRDAILTSPSVVRFPRYSLLFVVEDEESAMVGISPATVELSPVSFP